MQVDRPQRWMLYGCTGYSGRLIAEAAVARGLRPVLAGRSQQRVAAVAQQLDCPCQTFPLGEVEEIRQQLAGLTLVLNCAGPFSATARPLARAALLAGVHYLDITGEIDIIQWMAQQDAAARSAGVTLLPAVGFDVVPSDCLAARLARQLPDATLLQLAFTGNFSISPGTAKTILSYAGQGGRVRIDGRISRVPTAWKLMQVPFPGGTRWAATFPWGDVASAFYTTGIPNIEVYVALPRWQLKLARASRWLEPLLRTRFVQSAGRWLIGLAVKGPGAEQRRSAGSQFWGRATDRDGRCAEATLTTPDGYSLTIDTALQVVKRVLAGSAPPGFHTPGRAFGDQLLDELPGVHFRWIQRP